MRAWEMWLSLYAVFVVAAIACVPGELVSTRRHHWQSYLRGAVFWAIFLAVYSLSVVLVQTTLRATGVRPLLSIDLTSIGQFGFTIVLSFVPAFILDVAYYWTHRLQHAVPFLWRFHSVHHAIEELNAVNCSHHWTDGLVRVLLITVPLMFLIELRVPEIVAITIILGAWGQVVHANTSLGFGPLSCVFVSPRFHRVHHSIDDKHHHKNFAGVFPVIDMVFGTAYFPKSDEAIRTGLADKREHRSLIDYLTAR